MVDGRTLPIKFRIEPDALRCVGVYCHVQDQCHVPGVRDPATGACSNPAAANGTPCDDGSACSRVEERLVDIVAGGYDAGVRASETIERDMVQVRLTDGFRFVVARWVDCCASRFQQPERFMASIRARRPRPPVPSLARAATPPAAPAGRREKDRFPRGPGGAPGSLRARRA